jgi:LacI family transcriptional regulator
MTTVTDVAARAGVAPSVVSRVLNEDSTLRIRPETRERIIRVVEELGYIPNFAGRALRQARTGALGLIVPDVTNPVYADVLRGAEQAASDAGYLILLGSAEGMTEREDAYKRFANEGRIDGVLLQRNNVIDDAVLARLSDTRVPTVLINSRLDGMPGSVTLDDAKGASVAVSHLIELGHSKIAHLSGPARVDWAARRNQGYRAALASTGVRARPTWVVEAGYDEEGGHDAMLKLLRGRSRPTAVFVATVRAAFGALAAARAEGLRVPDELSLVAVHDTWTAEHTWPPLTTVKMPLFEMGRLATTSLIARISGDAEPTDLVVRQPLPILVRRESTAPPAR